MASLAKLPLVSRLSDRVIRILACNPGFMTLQGTNTYLVGTGSSRLLIDTGDGNQSKYIDLLSSVLKEENASISDIYITHWHEDHIGGLHRVKYLLQHKLGHKAPLVWKGRRERSEQLSPPEIGLVFVPYSKFKTLEIEGATVFSMHTPGHSTDHHCFYLQEEEAAFSGDCVLGEGTTVFQDLSAYMKSLNKLLNWKPKVLYPGHGAMVQDGIKHIQSYIDHRDARDLDIIYLLDQQGRPLTEQEITERIYKNLPEELFKPALSNVLQHLLRLEGQGRIHGQKGEWYTQIFYE